MLRPAATACLLCLCACSSESPEGSEPPPADSGPDPVCDVHAVTGVAKFVDRSAEWGLDDPTKNAWTMSSADLDGDGHLDIVGHVPAGNVRGVPGGEKYYAVLMNEPNPSGGRHFVDRTAESGYGATPEGSDEYRVASGAVFGDVDNDGDVDVLSLAGVGPPTQSPPTPADLDRSQLLLNDGSGKFALALDAGVATAGPEPVWSGTLGDWDLDGDLDAFVANWLSPLGQTSAQQMLEGDGSGNFTDVSAVAGLTDAIFKRGATGITACDVDDDGAPELLVSAYGRMPNLLLERGADGFLVDHAVVSGYAYDAEVNYSDDQWFLCYCADNPTAEGCAGAVAPQIVCSQYQWIPGFSDQPERLGGNTFTTICSDITGDGKLDLYNAEIQHWWAGQASDPSALLVNASSEAGILFERPSRDQTGMHWEHTGVSWDEGGIDAAAGDLDNDGREEVVIGRSDYVEQWAMIFHQKPDGTFEETAKASGISHACAATPILGDFDRDGDLDVVLASSRMREWCSAQWDRNAIRFYENDASEHGSWLAVRLVGNGTTTNSMAIGARVTAQAGGTKIVKEVVGGYGHGAQQQDSVLFFGLGSCESVSSIEVRWPDQARTVERWENVGAKRVIELRMGDPAVHEALAPP